MTPPDQPEKRKPGRPRNVIPRIVPIFEKPPVNKITAHLEALIECKARALFDEAIKIAWLKTRDYPRNPQPPTP